MKRKSLNKKKLVVLVAVSVSVFIAVIARYLIYIQKEESQPSETPSTIQADSYPIEPEKVEVEEVIEEPEPRTDAKLLIFGDTAFLEPLSYLIYTEEDFDPLANVSEKFQEYDYVVGNHEATIDGASVGSPQEGKNYTFSTPADSVEYFKKAGIDAFTYANNHTKDYGPASVLHTIELLKAEGIEVFGAGANSAEAFSPLVIDINGNQISFLGFNCAEYAFNLSGENSPGAAYYNETLIRNAITDAKSKSSVLIIMPHCGSEHETEPNEIQRKWGRVFTSAGADFVVGNHPHVRQAAEIINGVTVVHSVGNFMFPGQSWNPEAQKGWAVEIIIENNEIVSYQLLDTLMDENGVPSWADSL